MDALTFAHLFRFLVVALAAVFVGLEARVIQLYLRGYHMMRHANLRGLLPLHVSAVALSQTILVAIVIGNRSHHFEEPLSLVDYASFVAVALALVAMVAILRYQKLKVDSYLNMDRRAKKR